MLEYTSSLLDLKLSAKPLASAPASAKVLKAGIIIPSIF